MKTIAETMIDLPFALDFCAQGPAVAPLTCRVQGYDVTVHFPPSLSETTDGQGIFGDWAWWTGRRLRLSLEKDVASVDDVELLRECAVSVADEVLRRLLNSCRRLLQRPDIIPVRLDPRAVDLFVAEPDGSHTALAEPVSAFFYKNFPETAPLDTSINATTLDALASDVRSGREAPMSEQLELDAQALEIQGEFLRADLIRTLARMQLD
ncbi:MAG: hypothetical protein ACLQVD_15075 [Capsulimonadaceae bacterium]